MNRINELDFLKCLFILLMVAFHLTYISAVFPCAKQVVYTFHMPGFLVISGYLMNIRKEAGAFLRMMWWLFVPYVVMESGYIVMASLLPINEHIDNLTPMVFLERLLVRPLGPYWYLQAMILCGAVYYVAGRLLKGHFMIRLLACVGACKLLSLTGALSFPCAMYFFAGAVARMLGMSMKEVFRPMWLSVVLFAVLMVDGANLDKATPGGLLIVYFVMSAGMWFYAKIPRSFRPPLLWVGRNTMVIYLFSPIFTIVCRQLLPLFPTVIGEDARAVLFMTVALPLCVLGSVATARLLELTGTARLMFGKNKVLVG